MRIFKRTQNNVSYVLNGIRCSHSEVAHQCFELVKDSRLKHEFSSYKYGIFTFFSKANPFNSLQHILYVLFQSNIVETKIAGLSYAFTPPEY